jgi:hypothetical protein
MSSASDAARRSSISRDFLAAAIVFAKQRTAMGWGMARSVCLGGSATGLSATDRGSPSVIVINVTQPGTFRKLANGCYFHSGPCAGAMYEGN